MWPPADITALPTSHEVIDAKLAIESVKAQLNDALVALAQAQLRVDELNKELFERKAWIAPVRYLSFDVLSLVFEFCGEDNWRTPLLISEVSRYWREIVLATPRAWVFLCLHDFEGEHQMIYRFFSRSGQCPLHMYLPSSMVYPARILSAVENRLKCLSIQVTDSYVEGRIFPTLDSLTLRRDSNAPMEISHFNDIQLPSLRHFMCNTRLTNSSGVTQCVFPPLQTLSLQITRDLAWLGLLIAVKNTLVSLRLCLFDRCTVKTPQISLPTLKSLDIQFWHAGLPFWPLDLKTPALETYVELTGRPWRESLYHNDTQNVRNMKSDHAPTLSSFPLLEIVQLKDELHISAVFTKLASNESLCPKLNWQLRKTYFPSHSEPLDAKLPMVNRCRCIPVKLVVSDSSGRELPYAIKLRLCGDRMPCNEY